MSTVSTNNSRCTRRLHNILSRSLSFFNTTPGFLSVVTCTSVPEVIGGSG